MTKKTTKPRKPRWACIETTKLFVRGVFRSREEAVAFLRSDCSATPGDWGVRQIVVREYYTNPAGITFRGAGGILKFDIVGPPEWI